MSTEAKCPFTHTAAGAATNTDWWPNQLNLKILHQHSPLSDPMDKEFNYAEEFKPWLRVAPRRADRGPLPQNDGREERIGRWGEHGRQCRGGCIN